MPTSSLLRRAFMAMLLGMLLISETRGQQPQATTPRGSSPATAAPGYYSLKLTKAQTLARTPRPARTFPAVAATALAPLPPCFEALDTVTAGSGWVQVLREDDASTGAVPLGFGFSLYGTVYNSVYVNNNGNITFGGPLSQYDPLGFPIATPIISPFWADVDTSPLNSGSAWYKVFPDRLVVIWNRVGYYNSQQPADKKNTFQVTIRANTAPGFTGNDVLFAYGDMQWTTGTASGGMGGFGGAAATVGVNKGDSLTFIQTGRFDRAGTLRINNTAPGGVDWLDGQCLEFRVGSNSNNVPPAVSHFPQGNVLNVAVGQTISLTGINAPEFIGPEPNQTVTVRVNTNGLCNTTATVINNGSTNPTASLTVTGSACNVGPNSIVFTATDNGTPALSETFTLNVVVTNTPLPPPNQWTGAVSTDYGTPANWSANTVPGASDDVTIPGVAIRMPVLSGPADARNVTIAGGASLTITAPGSLRMSGNLTNDGTLSGAGTLLTTGNAVQSLGGNSGVTIANVTVGTGGMQLNTELAVGRLLTLNGNLSSNGRLTLFSSPTGTAMVVNNGSATVSGTATVQRFIDGGLNAGLGYRHLGAPVGNAPVSDLSTTSYTPIINPAYNTAANPKAVRPFPNIFFYDQSRVNSSANGASADFDLGWVSPASETERMVPARGYTVNLAAGQTVDFVGTLNNGAVTLSGLGRSSQAQAGWHLLSNPYPAPIDWNEAFLGATNLLNAVYVYKSTGQYAGTYASYVNGVGTNGGTSIIPMAQGFFVRTSAPDVTGSLALTNAARLTTYTDAPLQRMVETRPLVRLSLTGNSLTDQVAVYFQAGATPGFDAAFDAAKLNSSHGLFLAVNNATGPLAINGLPLWGTTPVTVPLLVEAARPGTYTLRADQLLNLPADLSVELRNELTGTTLNLRTQSSYSFTVDAQYAPRFTLVLRPSGVLTTTNSQLSEQVQVYPNPARQQLWLRLPTTSRQPGEATIYNALGQQVMHCVLAPNRGSEAQALPIADLAKGVYSLRVSLPEGTVTKRIIIE